MIRIGLTACLAVVANVAFGQTSELFLTSYSSYDCYVVQNGQIVRQFTRTATNDGPALIVQSTIRMFGQYGGSVGREYSLTGTLLAGSYPNSGFVDCYDGATDGTRAWTISHNDFSNNFAVLVGNTDWTNMQIAFVPLDRSSGIAYDGTDDTLWISNNVGGCDNVQHYSTAGSLLGEFPVGPISGGGYGIALDPADNTLWIPGAFGTVGTLYQYNKGGALLQTVSVPGMTSNTLGAEFKLSDPITTFCTAGTTTNGCVPSISGTGTPSASASSSFNIQVASVEGQRQGLLFYGLNNTGFTPVAWGPSTSFLCVKPPTQRTTAQSTGGTANQCNGSLNLDWNAFLAANPSALGNPFSAGQQVFAQGWFRDPPSPKTTMLSNGLSFTVQP